jgi:hypothetical protein
LNCATFSKHLLPMNELGSYTVIKFYFTLLKTANTVFLLSNIC